MEIYLPPWILLLLPGWIIIYQDYKRVCQKLQTKAKFLINKYCIKIASHRWHCTVFSTDSPIHIHKFIPPEVWKAFNVGINAWNITAVLQSNGDTIWWISPFSWRSFHIHITVYQMWPECYSSWFNWRHSITCTHCNVISLEHDSIPWWEKSQRIDVDATSLHLLWQLFTIIKSFEEDLNWSEDLTICQKPTKYGQVMFCEAVKVNMANSKETSFKKTMSSTLSLITVLFEDLFEAITLHRDFSGENVDIKPSTSLLNKTNTCDGYEFNIDIITDEVNALQKESLMLFEGFCIFGYREFYKNLLCILTVVNKTIYGNNGDVPDILLNMFLLRSPGIRNHMNLKVGAPDPVIRQGGFTDLLFPQSYRTILNKQEFIIHNSVTWPVQYSLSTLPTMSTIYNKPGAGSNIINTDN